MDLHVRRGSSSTATRLRRRCDSVGILAMVAAVQSSAVSHMLVGACTTAVRIKAIAIAAAQPAQIVAIRPVGPVTSAVGSNVSCTAADGVRETPPLSVDKIRRPGLIGRPGY